MHPASADCNSQGCRSQAQHTATERAAGATQHALCSHLPVQGDYRTAHSRLITYAEEIAFFEGSQREQNIITALFDKLFKHAAWVHKLHGLVGSELTPVSLCACRNSFVSLCLVPATQRLHQRSICFCLQFWISIWPNTVPQSLAMLSSACQSSSRVSR